MSFTKLPINIISNHIVGVVDFVKVNCAEHGAFCRSRKIKHFPTVEIYTAPPGPSASLSDKTRFSLYKGAGNFSVTPFRSDFSYEGFKAALEECNLIPVQDPYNDVKVQLGLSFQEAYAKSKV